MNFSVGTLNSGDACGENFEAKINYKPKQTASKLLSALGDDTLI